MFDATYMGLLPFAFTAGFAVGATAGIGTPSMRIYLGARWVQRASDKDGDRVADDVDLCAVVVQWSQASLNTSHQQLDRKLVRLQCGICGVFG